MYHHVVLACTQTGPAGATKPPDLGFVSCTVPQGQYVDTQVLQHSSDCTCTVPACLCDSQSHRAKGTHGAKGNRATRDLGAQDKGKMRTSAKSTNS
jgi:hypothetical protein